MVDLILGFNLFSVKTILAEIDLKGKLKCNKCVHFLRIFTTPIEERDLA